MTIPTVKLNRPRPAAVIIGVATFVAAAVTTVVPLGVLTSDQASAISATATAVAVGVPAAATLLSGLAAAFHVQKRVTPSKDPMVWVAEAGQLVKLLPATDIAKYVDARLARVDQARQLVTQLPPIPTATASTIKGDSVTQGNVVAAAPAGFVPAAPPTSTQLEATPIGDAAAVAAHAAQG